MREYKEFISALFPGQTTLGQFEQEQGNYTTPGWSICLIDSNQLNPYAPSQGKLYRLKT